MRSHRKNGFTFIEILVVVAVVGLMATVSIAGFSAFTKKESLEAGTASLVAALRDARAQTLASVGGSQYGISVSETGFVFFKGAAYDPGSPLNESTAFGSYVRASSTRPSYVFQRITGNAVGSGTIELYLVSDPLRKRTVTVEPTGIIDIE